MINDDEDLYTITHWLDIRWEARKKNDFKMADAIREIVERKFKIKVVDTKGSYTWHEDND
jgi:cysteinyl-tRNA synthetase